MARGLFFLAKRDTAIRDRIIEVRKVLGLTQKKFGDGINVSQSYFSNIELQERKINDRIITLICLVYGVSENWLRSGAGTMFDKDLDSTVEGIIRNFKKLDGLLQDYVIKQLDLLVEYQEKKAGN
jgi:transcriptional regulator with XRE-family HTH domain